jgi:hypothetical protein
LAAELQLAVYSLHCLYEANDMGFGFGLSGADFFVMSMNPSGLLPVS